MIVTVEADALVPRVRIDTAGASVSRVVDGVSTPVRGLLTAGTVYDYECPQEVPVAYDDGLTVSDLVEMPEVGVWLLPASDPLVGVRLTVGAFTGWSQSAPVSIADIPGRARPVAVSWRRGGRRGPLRATVLEQDDYAALCATLATAGPFLLSYSDGRWPALAGEHWVVIGDTSEEIVGLPIAPAAWHVELALTAVDRPALVTAATVTIDSLGGTIDSLTGTIDSLGS